MGGRGLSAGGLHADMPRRLGEGRLGLRTPIFRLHRPRVEGRVRHKRREDGSVQQAGSLDVRPGEDRRGHALMAKRSPIQPPRHAPVRLRLVLRVPRRPEPVPGKGGPRCPRRRHATPPAWAAYRCRAGTGPRHRSSAYISYPPQRRSQRARSGTSPRPRTLW